MGCLHGTGKPGWSQGGWRRLSTTSGYSEAHDRIEQVLNPFENAILGGSTMAEHAQPSRSEQRLQQSAFIRHLVPDPSQSPDVKLVVGFLGQSAQAGYVRLYLTPELNEYL